MWLVLTDEDSSTLDMTLVWRGLVLMMEEACLAMKCSRNSTCSFMDLCVNLPSAVTSRHRSASMSISEQKRRNNMLSGKDRSGPVCINIEKLA